MDVTFYDVKTREKVTVTQANLTKTKYTRTTKNGTVQTRYAVRANYMGRKLTKFVSREDWDALNVPQE